MPIQGLHLKLFADHFQFHIWDEALDADLSESWTQDACDRMLAMNGDVIGVGTARNMTVPVDLEVFESPPPVSLVSWDQVNECSTNVPSGRLVIMGCTELYDDALRVLILPGAYRVRLSYGKLDEVTDDGLDGNDHYRVQLWPAPLEPLKVLKQREIDRTPHDGPRCGD